MIKPLFWLELILHLLLPGLGVPPTSTNGLDSFTRFLYFWETDMTQSTTSKLVVAAGHDDDLIPALLAQRHIDHVSLRLDRFTFLVLQKQRPFIKTKHFFFFLLETDSKIAHSR